MVRTEHQPPMRGQIWEHVRGSRQYRVLIISNDEYNELSGATPWAVTVERGGVDLPGGTATPGGADIPGGVDTPGGADIPGYTVSLGGDDPLPTAVAVIPRVLRCDTTALRRCLGSVTGETLRRVDRGLREFLSLS